MRLGSVTCLILLTGCVNRTDVPPSVVLSATPTVVPADGNSVVNVSASFATVVPQKAPPDIQLVLQSSDPNALITQFSAVDANGFRWAQVRSFVPGTATLTLTAVEDSTTIPLPQTVVVTFNPLPPPPPGVASGQTSWLVANPNFVADDGQTTTTLTLQVLDSYGTPVPGVGVTFTSTGSNNFFSNVAGITDVGGVLAVTLASTTPETKVVTAHTDVMAVSAPVTFSPLASSALFSTLTASPNTLTADGVTTTTLTLTVRDAERAPLADVPVAWTVTGGNNTMVAGAATTDANGIATATLASSTAETKTVTATSGAAHVSQRVTFLPGAMNTSNCTFVVNPNRVVADTASVAVLTFTARDAFGNGVPNATVSFTSSGSSNALTPSTGTTDGTGTFSATLASSTAESKIVTAHSGGATLNQTVVFVPGAPSSATATLSASPNALTADGVSTSALTIIVEDAEGNPVPGQAVTFSSTGSGYVFSGTTCTTGVDGTCFVTLKSSVVDTVTVTASFAGLTRTTPVAFVPGGASSTTSFLAASPNTVTDDGVTTTTLQINVADVTHNPITGQAVTFSTVGTACTFSATTCTTNAGLCSVTLKSTTAQTVAVTATFSGLTKTTSVTFTTGAASNSTSSPTATPTFLTADGIATTTLLVTVDDATHNVINGQAVTFGSSGTGYVFSATACTTVSTGQCSVTLKSTVAQTVTVTANFAGVQENATATFVAGSPSSTTSFLTASPNALADDNVALSTLQISVSDVTGNPVNGQAVTFSNNGTNAAFSASTCTTTASGLCAVTLKSSTAQTLIVFANFAGVTKTATVIFTLGTPSSTTSVLTATPSSVPDDGSSTSTLQITVEDGTGNAINGQAVTFTTTATSYMFSAVTCTTASAGQCSVTIKSTAPQAVTVTAAFAGLNKTAALTFNIGNPNATTSGLSASPSSLADDGVTQTTLQVTVNDATGNHVSGQAVTFSSTGNDTFSATVCTTVASGQCSVKLKSSTAQGVSVTADFAGVSENVAVIFLTGSPNNTTSFLTASPNSLVDDNVATSTLQISVEDPTGNPITGQAVTFSSTPSTGTTLSATTCTTVATGWCSVILKSSVAESVSITAAFAGLLANATATFVTGSPNGATSSLTASPNSLVVSTGATTSALTVTVRDATGNLISGQLVTLTASGPSTAFSPASGNTNSSGVFTSTVSSTHAQNETITATMSAASATATITFVAASPNTTMSTVVANPTSVIANNSNTTLLNVTINDAFGNPINGQSVTMGSTGSANTFNPASGSTSMAGVFTATLASTKAQTKTVTATAGAAAPTGTVTFVPGPASATLSTLSVSPNSLVANGTSQTTVTLTLEDGYGNLIPNQLSLFSVIGAAGPFSATNVMTQPTGKASTSLVASYFGANTVAVRSDGIRLTAAVTFTKPAGYCGTGNALIYAAATTAVGSEPCQIIAGYVAGNSNISLIAADFQTNQVAVVSGNGNGSFKPPVEYNVGSSPQGMPVAFEDLNADGYPDIVATGTNPNQVSVLLGTATGTFGTAVVILRLLMSKVRPWRTWTMMVLWTSSPATQTRLHFTREMVTGR